MLFCLRVMFPSRQVSHFFPILFLWIYFLVFPLLVIFCSPFHPFNPYTVFFTHYFVLAPFFSLCGVKGMENLTSLPLIFLSTEAYSGQTLYIATFYAFPSWSWHYL